MSSQKVSSAYGFAPHADLPASTSEPGVQHWYDSDTDLTEAEDIQPWLSNSNIIALSEPVSDQVEVVSITSDKDSNSSPLKPFRPDADTPKSGSRNARYNRIRDLQVKTEVKDEGCGETLGVDSGTSLTTTRSQSRSSGRGRGTLTKKAGDEGRPKRQASKRVAPSKMVIASAVESPTNAASYTRVVGSPKVSKAKKEGTSAKRKGPSDTKGAVDCQIRKKIQYQYQQRLAELLDDDIIDQVEEEGGITPHGRMYKAAVRMLERVAEKRAGRVTRTQDADLESMRQKVAEAERGLRDIKAALQALVNSS